MSADDRLVEALRIAVDAGVVKSETDARRNFLRHAEQAGADQPPQAGSLDDRALGAHGQAAQRRSIDRRHPDVSNSNIAIEPEDGAASLHVDDGTHTVELLLDGGSGAPPKNSVQQKQM